MYAVVEPSTNVLHFLPLTEGWWWSRLANDWVRPETLPGFLRVEKFPAERESFPRQHTDYFSGKRVA